MAIVLTNGQFYIAHNKSGAVIKVPNIAQAQNFYSVERAICQKNKAPGKCSGYYYIDTDITSPKESDQVTAKDKKKSSVKRKRYSTEQRKLIYKNDNGRCQLCGRKIEFERATLDHVIPLSQGGIDSLDNIKLACESCNRQKASYLPDQFIDRITEIFMYQMEKKCGKSLRWKICHKLMMEIM